MGRAPAKSITNTEVKKQKDIADSVCLPSETRTVMEHRTSIRGRIGDDHEMDGS